MLAEAAAENRRLLFALDTLLVDGEGVILDMALIDQADEDERWVYLFKNIEHPDEEGNALRLVDISPRNDLPHGTRLRRRDTFPEGF
jgi:hypothetical protein